MSKLKLYDAISLIIDETGVQNLTFDILQNRCKALLNVTDDCTIDLSLDSIQRCVKQKVEEEYTSLIIAKYYREKTEGLVSKGKKKRSKRSVV